MLYRDTDVSRQLAGERHDELRHDRLTFAADATEPSQIRRPRRAALAWLRTQLRSGTHVPARHPS